MIRNGEGCPGKSRHLRVRWHFIRELLEDNFIKCEHIDTNLMVADVLTKPMGGAKFREFRRLMMNYDLEDMEGENTEGDENN
jgi:hypothetical protein